MAKKGRPFNPPKNEGKHDKVMTPPELAQEIVDVFPISGVVLDPCEGTGSFSRALRAKEGVSKVLTCELDRGEDFFDFDQRVDWVVSNPPFSKHRAFCQHAFTLSDNVLFLVTMCHAFALKARIRDMHEAGFGWKHAVTVPTPPKPWPSSGHQLAAVWLQRGEPWDFIMTMDQWKERVG